MFRIPAPLFHAANLQHYAANLQPKYDHNPVTPSLHDDPPYHDRRVNKPRPMTDVSLHSPSPPIKYRNIMFTPQSQECIRTIWTDSANRRTIRTVHTPIITR